MAREIKLSQIGDYAEEQLEKLLRATVLETDRDLKMASPVDLGRFRMSWAIGENAAPFEGVPKGDYRGQPIPPPRAVNYRLGSEKLGNVYSIHNNLPYAEKLATGDAGSGEKVQKRSNPSREVTTWKDPGGGSSIQTGGPGWVQGVAKDIQTKVKQRAAQIGRES